MTAAVTVLIGHDVRHWSRFAVRGASTAEIATLQGDDEAAAIALLAQIAAAGRLDLESEDTDESTDPFDDSSHPAIIDLEVEVIS